MAETLEQKPKRRGRQKKSAIVNQEKPTGTTASWAQWLHDPVLLDVNQYELSEDDLRHHEVDALSPLPSSAAEPQSRSELNMIVEAAAYQDSFSVVPSVSTNSEIKKELDAKEDSSRAYQVKRRPPHLGAVASWRAEEVIVQPKINIGHSQKSVHVVDLRARIMGESTADVAKAFTQLPQWQHVTREHSGKEQEDDFFLDKLIIIKNKKTSLTTNMLAKIGEHTWLYWSLVGQVLGAVPNYIKGLWGHGQSTRRPTARSSPWRLIVKPSLTLAVVAIIGVIALSWGTKWVRGVIAEVEHLTNQGQQAMQQLEGGFNSVKEFNFQEATVQLQNAQQLFKQTNEQLATKPSWLFELAKLLPGSAGKGGYAQDLVKVGQELASGGAILSQTLVSLQFDGEQSLTQQLDNLKTQLQKSQTHLESAQKILATIPVSVLDPDQQQSFKQLQQYLPVVIAGVKDVSQLADFAYGFLGGEGGRTYLVLSQNPNELRGTGGFLGGLALLKINQGKIEQLNIPGGGTYDTQAALKVKVIGPKPLRLLRDGAWYLWDANWWPDGPMSLDKIEWFWKNSDGSPVDGVMTVSAQAFADLLAVTGPIAMPEYDKIITSENFIVQTQNAVELEYDRTTNKPKQFLADITPKMVEKLLTLRGPQLFSALASLQESLARRQILFKLHDDRLQNLAHQWGWDGAVKLTGGDYLMVADSNVGGGKTDGVIKVEINHRAEVQADGRLIDTVRITRTHRGTPGDIFTGQTNVDYVRIYVPEGAELISAAGFDSQVEARLKQPPAGAVRDSFLANTEDKAWRDEISGTRIIKEFGKTVFANWVVLPVGESRTVEIRYRLPQRLWAAGGNLDWLSRLLGAQSSQYSVYQLLIQQQPGTIDRQLTHELLVPAGNTVVWSQEPAGMNLEQQSSSLSLKGVIDSDKTYGAIISRKAE